MNLTDITVQIKDIMAQVFEKPVGDLPERPSVENLPQWDSLRHITLILALEETFNIQLSETEIVDIQSLDDIQEIIQQKVTV